MMHTAMRCLVLTRQDDGRELQEVHQQYVWDWADEALKYYPGNTDDEARLSAEKPKANVKERTV